jgi:hypothetical protein
MLESDAKRRTARLCAAILDCRDTVPAPPFSTAVNTRPLVGSRPATAQPSENVKIDELESSNCQEVCQDSVVD